MTDPFSGRRVLIVAAHADDEVLGAGGQFASMASLTIVHVTDGAPSRRVARAHGFATRLEYATARRLELRAALAGTGAQTMAFGLRDQHASFAMAPLARALALVLRAVEPEVVITHAYEGGHPDHDATAFATMAAGRLAGSAAQRWDMAGYHAQPSAGVFLDGRGVPLALDPAARARKRAMLAAFATQADVTARADVTTEWFRPAPVYDVRRPPHDGALFYELRPRGMTGAMWRGLARRAEADLFAGGRSRREWSAGLRPWATLTARRVLRRLGRD